MMKSEKGQALPLAIMALAIGTLLITPFLGHASSAIIGSHTYYDAMAYRNACDAGVEHGIWRLVYDGLSTSIPNVGDHVSYPLAEVINGVTPTVTVTTNSTGGGTGTIDITGIIDSLEFDTADGYLPEIIHVSGNIYAIAYQGTSGDGFIKTVSIDSSGIIGNSTIDVLEFDTVDCKYVDLVHVSGNIYAIAYQGSGDDGFIKTVSITSNGIISNSVIDSLEFDTSNGREPSIIQVSFNVYAVAYRGPGDDGFVKTFNIDGNGIMGDSTIDTLEFDTSNGRVPACIHISGNTYAIAYMGVGNDGFIKTISIDINGIIANSVIDTLEFDTTNCVFVDIINIAGNVYALAYQGPNDDGFVKTVAIDANGAIGNSVIDTLEFDTAEGWTPVITHVSGSQYAIAYQNNGDGIIKTISIDSSGNIDAAGNDTFTFDATAGYEPAIVQVTGGVYAIAYRGSGNDGYVVTIGITTGGGVNKYRIDATAGDTTIQAYVIIDGTTASIISWKIN
jgi:hypothetical protein